ncbi:uncharacterized protein LOC135703798 [Ochlerotatus camptorhynchus]|uniref:uncharacterized protein LOC135703798 n=1 Tax=Ochlerotatus camptorhynchus TaxID=644619 RepID=UPI0031D3FEB4
MTSNYSNFTANVDCLVTPKVTGTIPSANVRVDSWHITSGVLLADASFNRLREVEMLIGAEHFFNILKQGQIKLADHLPTLYETQFGWVVAGSYEEMQEDSSVCVNLAVTDGLEACLQRFFDQEEIAEPTMMTSEEERFEEHFQRTYRRNEDGRFVVQLPFRESVDQLKGYRSLTLKRFLLLEKILARDPDLKAQYAKFIDEYQSLGHCREVREEEDPPGLQSYYLPHHCVFKPSSSSTKFRVVFDATTKASKLSLHDVLMTGTSSQSDLFSIVLRFRTHTYVFTVDVSKMYRQILVDPSQTQYQRIFWRGHLSEVLKALELLTVTYASPDESEDYPTKKLRRDLEELMLKGGFPIRKWCSNSEDVLEGIPEGNQETLVPIQDSSANEVIKALGLLWDPKKDLFLFFKSSEPTDNVDKPTKRRVLSQIAKLFDPLGLVSPVIVEAKMILQCLWATNLGWDEPMEGELLQRWTEFQTSLSHLNNFKTPRCVVVPDTETMEIHGFADFSKCAYGACIYLRCIRKDGSTVSNLLCSKSKVAPLRELTIPRLELCAAQLLAKLVDKVIPTLKLEIRKIRLWSDSQIALAWIRKPLDGLQVFIRNRVAEINKLTKHCRWSYVNTDENPADIVSRGMKPTLLNKCQLWWNGPVFLREVSYRMEPIEEIPDDLIPELKTVVIANPIVKKLDTSFERFDSFYKLQRVYAHIARLVRRVQTPKDKRDSCGRLTVQDMRKATSYIIRVLQQNELHEEIQCVQHGEIPRRLAALQPFIDKDGFLRVGGRLQNSKLSFDAKHQLMLPPKHRVTELLIKKIHEERLHEGQSGVLAAIRQRFWLINARSTIRKVIHNCMRCFRMKPRMIQPLMGNLPESRVNIAAPFELTGVDYAGPVFVKEGKRKTMVVKAYIALFVCVVSKAVHLELVSDLTSEAFLAALDRFVNRRGIVRKIFSDNGTNFVGAFKELRQLRALFNDELEKDKINNFLLRREVEWEFIPPRSPNFGGLWEAGVKVVKLHLAKTDISGSSHAWKTTGTDTQTIIRGRFYQSSDKMAVSESAAGPFLEKVVSRVPVNTTIKSEVDQETIQYRRRHSCSIGRGQPTSANMETSKNRRSSSREGRYRASC